MEQISFSALNSVAVIQWNGTNINQTLGSLFCLLPCLILPPSRPPKHCSLHSISSSEMGNSIEKLQKWRQKIKNLDGLNL